eukprot:CAMPEP_0168317360 /NCGR_PEP_ID=MMETSP0210-20121227/24614_1 /TAXON_ID=40633 /ORGANISM="Condylostoma magnum, Strain COL2" /LENGTH=83 /DNA_ID=CAMNT_0008315341 /DNA_START=362 /DNA_END=613 /DNA_ORIENTATION=+
MIVIGGYSSRGYLNDVYVYSISGNQWIKVTTSGEAPVTTSGDAPSPRELHSFVVYGRQGYLFGGFHQGGVSNELYTLDLELMV